MINRFQTSKQKVSEAYDKFCSRLSEPSYSAGEGVIADIARRNRFSPALTARSIVEADLTRSTGAENPPTKSQISPLIKDTNLIEDGALAYEVLVGLNFFHACFSPSSPGPIPGIPPKIKSENY